jgi:hypothetical protein
MSSAEEHSPASDFLDDAPLSDLDQAPSQNGHGPSDVDDLFGDDEEGQEPVL